MEDYYPILAPLVNQKLPFLVIGTWGLKYIYPERLQHYKVPDCDIIIKNDISVIRSCVRVLKDYDWSVTCWEESISEQVTQEFLKGKFYIRARKQKLTLDITYECPYISWEDMWTDRNLNREYPIASLEHILKLKEIKGSDKDLRIVRLFESKD